MTVPLMETSKSQLTIEPVAATTTKSPQEPTKKDTPHPKTEKKPQGNSRRGTIMVKSNPVFPRWVIHKLEIITLQRFFKKSASSEPYIRLPRLRVWQWRGALRESGFKGQWDLIAGLGKRETPLLKGTHKVSYTPGTGGEAVAA